jgi:hypothetical protein
MVLGAPREDELLVYRAGLGIEVPLGRVVFLDADVTGGTILNVTTLMRGTDGLPPAAQNRDLYTSASSQTIQGRLTAGLNIFKHLGVFAGLSYDYIHRGNEFSPEPGSKFGGLVFDWSKDRHIHRLGFFAGLQF